MKDQQIEIHITGPTNSGKTSLTYLITEFLKEKGFDVEVKESELKELNNTQMAYLAKDIDKKIEAISKKTSIKISEFQINNKITYQLA